MRSRFRLWLLLLPAWALAACSDPPETTPPESEPRRPAFSAEDALVHFHDERGTWSVALAGSAPASLVADVRPGRLYPSPWLDKLAIVRKGDGIEIYDRTGMSLGWIASDAFAGWTSNETVIAGLAKWDTAGNRLRDYSVPPQGAAPETSPFPMGEQSVSPDGRWLAVARYPLGYTTGPRVVLLSTGDGRVARTAVRDGVWARDGSYVSIAERVLTRISPDLKDSSDVALDIDSCGIQPWIRPDSILAWGWHAVSDYVICTEPRLVDAFTGVSSPLAAAPDGALDDERFRRTMAFAPDGTRLVFASQLPHAGVVVTDPVGANERRLAQAHAVTAVAWDSWNPDAPARDPAMKQPPPREDPPDVPANVPPGPPGTPPSMSDCRQGRWYRRTPATPPANWPSPRFVSAGAFDRRRGVLVVDGGFRVPAESTTWEWDGRTGAWTNRSVMGPARPLPRFGHAFVYDSKRSVFVLLGGSLDTNGTRSSTWWDWEPVSGTWAPLDCPGIGADFTRAVYDPGRDAIRALTDFGGGLQLPRSGCAPVSFRGPEGRSWLFGATLAFDPIRDRLLLAGSRSLGHGLWESDGTTWTQRDAAVGPGTHEHAAVAFDEERGRLMAFSGIEPKMDATGQVVSIGYPADLWEWNPDSASWTLCGSGSDAPLARTNAVMAWDPGRRALVLFGGRGYDAAGAFVGDLADVWEWAIP